MGLIPFRCWRAGEPRSSPSGKPLEGRWPHTYWTSGTIASGRWPGQSLPSAVSDLLDRLAPHASFFHQVRGEGGKVEFFIGWFLDGHTGGLFTPDLLGRLADFKIDISLCLYPPDQETDSLEPEMSA
jgi:hypothetical protein